MQENNVRHAQTRSTKMGAPHAKKGVIDLYLARQHVEPARQHVTNAAEKLVRMDTSITPCPKCVHHVPVIAKNVRVNMYAQHAMMVGS
jgi:hypothetical protein